MWVIADFNGVIKARIWGEFRVGTGAQKVRQNGHLATKKEHEHAEWDPFGLGAVRGQKGNGHGAKKATCHIIEWIIII